MTIIFDSREKPTSSASASGSSTPLPAQITDKQRQAEEYARVKAQKRAELEERTRANALRKEEARAAVRSLREKDTAEGQEAQDTARRKGSQADQLAARLERADLV